MSLRQILNLSQPRLAAAVIVGCAVVVGFSLQTLRYQPKVFDACEGVPYAGDAADADFDRAVEKYLEETRRWSTGDYCIDKRTTRGAERIASVYRRGKLVGGGEGFLVRVDPATMTALGEMKRE
jgi:hypothetical protein